MIQRRSETLGRVHIFLKVDIVNFIIFFAIKKKDDVVERQNPTGYTPLQSSNAPVTDRKKPLDDNLS